MKYLLAFKTTVQLVLLYFVFIQAGWAVTALLSIICLQNLLRSMGEIGFIETLRESSDRL